MKFTNLLTDDVDQLIIHEVMFSESGMDNRDYIDKCRSLIKNAIELLPEVQNQVIILYYYQDMSIGEIADFLKINRSTAYRRLSKARLKLTQLVNACIKSGII